MITLLRLFFLSSSKCCNKRTYFKKKRGKGWKVNCLTSTCRGETCQEWWMCSKCLIKSLHFPLKKIFFPPLPRGKLRSRGKPLLGKALPMRYYRKMWRTILPEILMEKSSILHKVTEKYFLDCSCLATTKRGYRVRPHSARTQVAVMRAKIFEFRCIKSRMFDIFAKPCRLNFILMLN